MYMGSANLFKCSSNVLMLTSLTLYKEITFIHTNNFSPLFFCPIFVLFWQTCMIFLSLLWLKTLFFTSLVVFGPIAMRHL